MEAFREKQKTGYHIPLEIGLVVRGYKTTIFSRYVEGLSSPSVLPTDAL
jgi:hypothetical protein